MFPKKEMDYEPFETWISFHKIMEKCIWLYGIGGVGKKTLVKEVYRQATKDKNVFDDVVLVLCAVDNESTASLKSTSSM